MRAYSLHIKLEPAEFAGHLAAITDAVTRDGLERARTWREVSWRKPSQPPVVTLHFDDGDASALAHADLRERAGWRGFFHIPTGRIGARGALTAADIRALHARGHVIGAHSCTHPARMSRLPRSAMLHEWSDSRAVLEDLTGAPVKVAAVPNGACSHWVVMAAEHAGIEILFNSDPISRFDWTLACLVLGRYTVGPATSPVEAARLATGSPLPRWEQWASWHWHLLREAST